MDHPQCDLNIQNEDGNTPLHIAALNDCDIALTILNDTRCNPHLSNNAGNTVLHIATEKKSCYSIQLYTRTFNVRQEYTK